MLKEEEIEKHLQQQVPDECVSERKGLSYVTGRYVKDTLNEVFGHLGWSYEVEDFEILSENRAFARVSLRVRLNDYDYVERQAVAVGYGPSKTADGAELSEARASEVLDFACAEAITDALKRAACSFGPVLGLHLYPLVGKGTPKKAAASKPAKQAAKKEEVEDVSEEW